MVEIGSSYSLGHRLDTKQILLEAQHRWLRPAEICEILRGYEKLKLSPQPPNKPISGSAFLFDRKVLKHYRKDGHNWRKRKDEKSLKESHAKLKVGSVDMLSCFYAHGEDNENFHRRSYLLLEQDLMHIVFVHYLDVKGNKTYHSYVRNMEIETSYSENGMSLRGTSPMSLAYEDAESDIKQILLEAQHRWLRPAEICEILRCYGNFKLSPQPPNKPISGSVFLFDRKVLRYFWKDGHNWRKRKYRKTVGETHEKLKVGSVDMLDCSYAHEEDNENFQRRSYWLLEQDLMHIVFVHYLEVKGNKTHGSYFRNIESRTSHSENGMPFRGTSPTSILKPSYEDCSFHSNSTTMNQNLMLDLAHVPGSKLFEKSLLPNQKKHMEHSYICRDEHKEQSEQINLQKLISDAEFGNAKNSNLDNVGSILGNQNYSFSLKMPMMLKKVHSFTRGFDKELGEADELQIKPNTGSSWSLMGGEDDSNMPGQFQTYVETLNPSITQDQLFSIFEFWPNWAYSNSETKVFVAGTFLKSDQELAKYRWSIMFGEVEVPAEVLADGFLCCYVPPQNPGLIPFYVTSSNRLACSEIREFEFRFRTDQNTDVSEHNASPATV